METVESQPTWDSVRLYLRGLNSGPRMEAAAFAPDAVIRYPGRPPLGVEEFRAQLESVSTAVASFEFATREVFETEHGVAASWRLTATTKAGRTVTCDGIDSWVIGSDGRIESLDVWYDPTPLVEALREQGGATG